MRAQRAWYEPALNRYWFRASSGSYRGNPIEIASASLRNDTSCQMKKINIGILGHSKSGKTLLSESLLYKTKAISRLGNILQGNTVMDFDPEEIKRGMSINLSLAYTKWKEVLLNFIDAPGYADFIGEVMETLSVADNILINISALEGIEVGTEKGLTLSRERNLPTAIFVNKLDEFKGDFFQFLKEIETVEKSILPVNLPVFESGMLKGIADLFSATNLEQNYAAYQEKITERVAESDDALLNKYLDEGSLTAEEIKKGFEKMVRERKIIPLLCGSSLQNIGIEPLLDFMVSSLPESNALPKITGINPETNQEEKRFRSSDNPFTALIFKTTFDPFAGKLSFFRIFSGEISSNSSIYNSSTGKKERVGQILRIFGKKQELVPKAEAGNFVAVAKFSSAQTGNTLSEPAHPIVLTPIKFPEPSISLSIKPKKEGTEDKLAAAFAKLKDEDKTIDVVRDKETGETIISGVGDLHLDITISRLKDKFGAEVIKGIPKVAYRETVTSSASVQGKYKRQTGGHGQYGDVWLRVESLPRGKGFEFVDEIKGGAIPNQYIPAVEKGILEAMEKGVIAGYPLTDFKAALYDGSFHTVDSSEIAFKIAASLALKKAVLQANPILLEPIMSVEVSVPQEFVGDIIGDINSKRGKVLSVATKQNNQLVKAFLPLSEMANYATGLRSLTKGKEEYTRVFSHYEVLPGHLAKKIIESREKKDD